jgi:hypothetical protein
MAESHHMPIEHESELKDLRKRALQIADKMDREHHPREYPGEPHVSEPPASTGDMQTRIRRTLPRIGEFDPTPKQRIAAEIRKLVTAVDHYLLAQSEGERR